MKQKLKNLAEVLFFPVGFAMYCAIFNDGSVTVNGDKYGASAQAIYGFVVFLTVSGLLNLLKDTYKAIKK